MGLNIRTIFNLREENMFEENIVEIDNEDYEITECD